mmetsp:Transcript_2097/g.4529  ORF Transcript_2097/g.4529 Transcript_2097/m.4529 type:complete len:220 (-) Transcript_2097:137-796(-)
MHLRRSSADPHLLFHSSVVVLLQKLLDRVAENSGACQLQSAFNFPGVSLTDQLHAPQQHRITWSRCQEPLLKLLHARELNFCTTFLLQAMSHFVAHDHAGLLGYLILINRESARSIHVSIVATLIPQHEVSEDISTLHGRQAFPNGPHESWRSGSCQLGNLCVIPEFVFALRILRPPSFGPQTFVLLKLMPLGCLMDDTWNHWPLHSSLKERCLSQGWP